jgi:tyrosyl-tRNA synthetase
MDKKEDLLTRSVKEIVVKKSLEKKLSSGKKLRIKLGIDPTVEDLHLGHAVVLRKLRTFQDLGHKAVLIIGDYTALIGDPSGKDKTRPVLEERQIQQNAKGFLSQAFKILDSKKTEHHFNSEWFKKFKFKDVIELASKMTVEHLMSHQTFQDRLKNRQPFFMHEMIYPLMQGYDSVMIKADVELGALEQKFNLLAGRKIQRSFGQKEQDVMMLKYLIGLDGKDKMSKSLGNYVSLKDSPNEMYGKIMSIPDKLIDEYYEMCVDIQLIKDSHPKEQKERLAAEIVRIYHGQTASQKATQEFERIFSKGQLPKKMAEYRVGARQVTLIGALVKTKLASSRSDARRLIEQGGVRLNQVRVKDQSLIIKLDKPKILQVGKRRVIRLKK